MATHSTQSITSVPPTEPTKINPDVGKPATVAGVIAAEETLAKAAAKPVAKTSAKPVAKAAVQPARASEGSRIAGASLVPDLDPSSNPGAIQQFRYWVGVTQSCPVALIDVAGICFPKLEMEIIDDPMGGAQKKSRPVIGAIVFLTHEKITMLAERLQRTVIRFHEAGPDDGQHEEGTGENFRDPHRRPRRGQLITIPSQQEVQARKDAGRATQQYVPGPNDVPAARFMFAHLCEDQTRGSRGESYPETLETAGLYWPSRAPCPT